MRVLQAMAFGAIMLTGAGGFASAQAPAAPPPATPMTLASSAFADGGVIPDKYTQASSTTPVSPALSWDNVPAGTASFALILHDPDVAPNKGSADVLHWMAFNIPAAARALPENVPTTAQLPDGTIQPNNLRGNPGFMGPGARGVYHHYTFELYALDTKLNLGSGATRPEVLAAMDGHIIGKAAYVGRFHR
ncbi:MAG: YbhB/YbcL family Raf kinase inhibitor-like protein [Pseudomonadota bacterium]